VSSESRQKRKKKKKKNGASSKGNGNMKNHGEKKKKEGGFDEVAQTHKKKADREQLFRLSQKEAGNIKGSSGERTPSSEDRFYKKKNFASGWKFFENSAPPERCWKRGYLHLKEAARSHRVKKEATITRSQKKATQSLQRQEGDLVRKRNMSATQGCWPGRTSTKSYDHARKEEEGGPFERRNGSRRHAMQGGQRS